MARSGGDIIGVEQVGKALVEWTVSGKLRHQQKLLEEPRRMRPMPHGRAGIRHRLDYLVLRRKQCRPPFGFRAHGAKCVAPERPRIAGRGRRILNCCDAAVIAKTNDRRRSRGRHAHSQAGGLTKLAGRNGVSVPMVPSVIYMTRDDQFVARAYLTGAAGNRPTALKKR